MSNDACFVCETSLKVKLDELESCPCCNSKIRTQTWLNTLSIKDKKKYLRRLSEAKNRWAKWGRYDQSPKNSNLPTITASSSNSVAIGGELV